MKFLFKNRAKYFDQHGLFALSLFLLIFIPLYPKIPLLEAIPGYLVRVRLEDMAILFTGLIWFITLIRQKIVWKTSFHFLIIGYAIAGLISLVVAIYLQQTIPLQLIHVGKSALHYFRYLEYFSLFLFMYAGVKTKRHAQIALMALIVTLNLIFIYGVGQRYLDWPAFSTMNREYSKGQSLILNPTDKLQSTFGGHYDLAAWLVIVIPLIISWALTSPSLLLQLWIGLSAVSGGWLLWESGSKTALAACLISLTLPAWLWLKTKLSQKKSNLVIGGGILTLTITVFASLWFYQRPTLYKLAPFLRPVGSQTPIDATAIKGDETWSLNARKYGLSMGIRLDTLWPQALDGFSINPFTGKGYATLSRKGETEFTEADGTDNNFLRVLGETGLLGFMAFFSLIILITRTLLLKLSQDKTNRTLTIGFVAATIGLLLNAFIIDVFAASKVAFTYWAMAGLALKSFSLENKKLVEEKEKLRFNTTLNWLKKNWPLLITSLFLILLVHKRPFTEYSLVKSFALSTKQAKYAATTSCLLESYQWQDCLRQYQPQIGAIYSLYLLPFYLLYSEPAMFYFANLLLMVGAVVLLDLLIKKFTKNSTFRFLLLLIIFTTPSFYTLPTKSSPANLWLLLALIIFNRLALKIKPRQISKLVNLGLLVVALVHLSLVQYFMSMTGGIVSSFRDTHRPSNYVAIRRADRLLEANKTPSLLLHCIEPTLFDIYKKGSYELESLEESSVAQHQLALKNGSSPELFITNANLDQSSAAQDIFAQYKNQFGIKLADVDCRHECNFYQLLADEIEIPTQPQAWTPDRFIGDSAEFNFLVVNNQLITDLGRGKYLTEKQLELRQELIGLEPDLIFLTGEAVENREVGLGTAFMQRLDPFLQVPIVSVLSGYESKTHQSFGPQFQRFEVGETWFITLDALSHHHSPAQNIFLYDTLLQLEKHPEIKHVYFISQDDQWLQQHPDNFYFWEDFPRQLEKFEKVEFKFVFSPVLEQEGNSPLPQQLKWTQHSL